MAYEEWQHVRLSPAHPRVHLASPNITPGSVGPDRSTLCGAALRLDSLLALAAPVTCDRCLAIVRRRARH